MKKTLLAWSILVGSIFFVYAQTTGDAIPVTINLNSCISISGNRACLNTATGRYQIINRNGGGVSYDAQTGQVGGSGTVGGVRVGGSAVLGGSQGSRGSTNQNFSGILGLMDLAQLIVVRAAPFLIGLAMLAFFFFLVEFIWKGRESAEVQEKSKKGILYSVLAIFVMVSLWGIVGFLGSILGIGQGGTMTGFKLPGEQ